MKSDTTKPPNCSGHMLCTTEFLSPHYQILFLAVGCMYKYPLPTSLMGFCSHTFKPAHIQYVQYIQYRGALWCWVLVVIVLQLWTLLGMCWDMGQVEPDLWRDPLLYHPGQPAPEYAVVHGCGLSTAAMGSSVIEPPLPCTENRCIKGCQRRHEIREKWNVEWGECIFLSHHE